MVIHATTERPTSANERAEVTVFLPLVTDDNRGLDAAKMETVSSVTGMLGGARRGGQSRLTESER